MKKIIALSGILLLASTALFAQTHVSIAGDFGTDFTGFGPSLNLEVNLRPVDVILGTRFWFYKSAGSYSNEPSGYYNSTTTQNYFKIYAGIAPKFNLTDKWTVTLPILVNYYHRNDKLDYDMSTIYSTSDPKKKNYNGIIFDFGARAYYQVTKHWSMYFGGIVDVFTWQDIKTTYWKSSASVTYTLEDKNTYWFDGGMAQLGVRYTF
jgi:hypothetical protein